MTLLTTTTLLALLATTATTTTAACTPRAPSTKYLITFGDSYSQTGFNITSTAPSASNPLGNPPLPGWTASGGYNWVGFLAAHYNVSTLLTYNFAYGGATTNASLVTPYEPTVLSFVDQVAEFSGSIGGGEGEGEGESDKLWTGEDALFGVWMGVNDVGNSWWTEGYGELVEEIMDSYFGRLQVLYEAGGRNFVLLSVPPIQRTPSVLNNSDEAAQQQEAAAIDTYNAALATRLEEFSTANSGVTAKIVDTAVPFNTALDDPTAYGAPDNTCFNADGESCLWFNDYHPGVEINNLVAAAVAEAWKGSFF